MTSFKRFLFALSVSPFAVAACGCYNYPIDARLPETVRRPERAAIVFFVDGLDRDTLNRLAGAGRLPNIRKYLLDPGVCVQQAVSVLPSITYAANVSMVTGNAPGHHDITGNHWFDRNQLMLENYRTIANYRDVDRHYSCRTIFEAADSLYSVTILTPVRRGSTRDFDNWMSTGLSIVFTSPEVVDSLTADRMTQIVADARRTGRWPDLIWAYFMSPDSVAHQFGKDSPRYESVLLGLDRQIGRICQAVEQAGMLDRTLRVLISDHGHVVVDPARKVRLQPILNNRLGLPTAFDIHVTGVYADRRAHFNRYRVALCDEGSRRAALSLRVGDDWAPRPTLNQIAAFHRDYGAAEVRNNPAPFWDVLLDEIKQPGALIAVRDGADRAMITDGESIGLAERRPGSREYRYRLAPGSPGDPLKLSATPAAGCVLDGKFHPAEQWLQATCDAVYPDMLAQVVDYFDSPRSGDLVVFAADGWDFSPHARGGHGGVTRQDVQVPMVFAGPGLSRGSIRTARIYDLAPTLLDYFNLPAARKRMGCLDGVSRWLDLSSPQPGVAK